MARTTGKVGGEKGARSSGSPGIRLSYSIAVPIGAAGSASVEIRVSTRRRKSSHAHLEAGKVVVVVPSHLSTPDREDVAGRLALKLLDPEKAGGRLTDAELERRATELGRLYLGGVKPRSIRFVKNQRHRWGSCTPGEGSIRLSSRLLLMPAFVLDSVIVHEMAHLIEPSHSPRFKALTDRYPESAAADAYLLGFEHGATTATMDLGAIPAEPWQARAAPAHLDSARPSVAAKPRRAAKEQFSQLTFGS